MDAVVTWQAVVTVGGFVVALLGFAFGVWKYVEGKVDAVRKDAAQANATALATATLAREELANHRLHVAEHYVSKEGHREATAMIMKSIEAVSDKLDHLTGRIDGLMKPATRTRSSP